MATNDAIINIVPEKEVYDEKKTVAVAEREMTSDGDSTIEKSKHGLRGARRRRAATELSTTGQQDSYDGEEDTVNSLGKVYDAVLNFHRVTRYAIYILPVSILLAIPLVIFATSHREVKIDGCSILGLFVWIQILWTALWVGKLAAKTLPYIFRFLCGFVSSGTRKYHMVLRKLEIPISLVIWTVIAYATVPVIQKFDSPRSQAEWVHTLRKVALASIAVACIFLAEKFIVQLIGITYHRKQFNGRIRASKKRVFMLDTLYEASCRVFKPYCSEFLNEDYIILTGVDKDKDPNAAKNLRMIGGLGWAMDATTTAFGNMASEITGQKVFDPTGAHNMVIEALETRAASEALAKRIWMSFVEKDSDALKLEDVIDMLGPEKSQQAQRFFEILDVDSNGDVSLEEMIMTVVDISRERKDMSRSMHDVNQAVSILDKFLMVISLMFIGVVYAAFFSQSFARYLATIGTQIAAISFALAGTAQEFLGSCIFLFVKHPYDVGDTVRIDDDDLEVKHISLLYTVFRRIQNNRTVQIPNIKLNGEWIDNVSRSKAMKEQVTMMVAASTSFDDIEIFRHELQQFVQLNENRRDFQPEVDVELMGVGDFSKSMELRVEVTHKSNWSNERLRQARRNKMMTAVISLLRTVPIYAPGCDAAASASAQLPNYTVMLSRDEVALAKTEFEDKKIAKRMYPVGYRPSPTEPQDVSSAQPESMDASRVTGATLVPGDANIRRTSVGRTSMSNDFADHHVTHGRR